MKKLTAILLMVVILTFGISSLVLADGTETLGPPSISIASGSGIVAAGVGLESGQPGTININVPGTVQQALLYWAGEFYVNGAATDTITVGGTNVVGDRIGGPAYFFDFNGQVFVAAYRADVTNMVASGANSLQIDGLDFDLANHGAGLLVIYDDGSTSEIDLLDGVDLAFFGFPEPRQNTVPQTFTFAPEPVERIADLKIFASSVGVNRPNSIEITVGGVTTTIINPLGSSDGELWDTAHLQAAIPAGVDSLTVQVFSTPSQDPLGASLTWIAAGLSVPVTPPGGEGCTPGGWAGGNGAFRWDVFPDADWNPPNGNPFDHDKKFNDFFTPWGSLDGLTMYDLVSKGGGKDDARKAARSLVAAYLNASHASVNYPLTTGELEALWDEAVAGDIEFIDLHRQLDEFNNLGCSFE